MTTWIIKRLSGLFRLIPGDGKKTMRGLAAVGLGYLFAYLGDYIPHQPSPDEITQIITHGEEVIVKLGEILQIGGLILAQIGIAHKAVKAVEPKVELPQWEK